MVHDEIWDTFDTIERRLRIANTERRHLARHTDALSALVATLTIQVTALMAESPANHPDTKGE